MATVTNTAKLGPLDHGLPMSFEDYMAGDYQEGYRYELIHGRLYVFAWPNLPETRVHDLVLGDKVKEYAWANPRIINYVTGPGRVFVPDPSRRYRSRAGPVGLQKLPRNREAQPPSALAGLPSHPRW